MNGGVGRRSSVDISNSESVAVPASNEMKLGREGMEMEGFEVIIYLTRSAILHVVAHCQPAIAIPSLSQLECFEIGKCLVISFFFNFVKIFL